MGHWARLAARAAFRKGKALYCGHKNEVVPGMWSGGIVGLKSILGVKRRSRALQIMNELQELGYIDYSLDRKNKHLTYQIKDWIMQCCGAECDRRFLGFLKKGGYLSDPEVENPEVRAKKRADNRRIYHNTQLMLEHYRDLVWAMESIPNDLKDELDVPLADLDILISRLDMELSLNNRRLESRIDALIKSRALVDRLNEAISFLRTKPGEGELLYQIIYHT